MPLFEVNRRFLQQKSENETYRFIHDPRNRISLHIWQKNPEIPGEIPSEITRFQVALENSILEWKNKKVSFGQVDSGEDVFGIKKSPVMMMSNEIDHSFLKKIVPVLRENENIAGMKFIIQIMEESGAL